MLRVDRAERSLSGMGGGGKVAFRKWNRYEPVFLEGIRITGL